MRPGLRETDAPTRNDKGVDRYRSSQASRYKIPSSVFGSRPELLQGFRVRVSLLSHSLVPD